LTQNTSENSQDIIPKIQLPSHLQKTAFLSDLHLGAEFADYQKAQFYLENLMEEWKGKLDALVLMGDIFEFWMEYRYYIPKHHLWFLSALDGLRRSGVEIIYLAGNHDFSLNSQKHNLWSQMGITSAMEVIVETQGQRIFCRHGDGLSQKDWKYRFYRKILLNKFNIFLFKLLHPDWGMGLARWVGKTSRGNNHCDAVPVQDYHKAARDLMTLHNCSATAIGHTHLCEVKEYPEGTFINCGQWLELPFSYVMLENGEWKKQLVE
jgi:UDP-2,3-diacylglucosamine hydrolase